MAVVRFEIKTRRLLADGRKFDHVGSYEQLDGTAHFAVDPGHRLNRAVTDIDLAERGRDGLVHFTADVRILAPADQARGALLPRMCRGLLSLEKPCHRSEVGLRRALHRGASRFPASHRRPARGHRANC